MTKESFPSRKGIRKIFSRKVIGLLIILLASLLFLTGFYSSTNQNQSISAEEQERFRNEIVEKYVKELEKDGYENITYKTSAIIEFSEKNHIQINMTRQPGESLDDMIIKRYDYYATYYKVVIGEKNYLFKNEDSAKTFIQNINKYDNNQYSIDKIKKLIKNETSQNEINDIIDIKKQEYEKKKAEEEARRKAAEERAKKQQSTTNNSSSSQSVAELQSYAHNLVINTYGWSEYDFECLVKLWNRESGWNPNAHNKSSGAHGVPQSLPASKMASEGADYYTNGYTQIRWGLKYIKNRYGSPSGAWAHSQRTGWY
ncbi:MAG: hypothetical protein IKC22_01460 [Bacilli bacterium]|nr:hypothetical protein [bacterium]MBR2891041.1 hypothetical protein [Bacilli bacterium]MBR4003298.1 hypothetical protein [Clostridia bacterium]